MQLLINHMFLQRTIVQLRTLKPTVVELAVLTVKDLEISLEVPCFVLEETEVLVVQLPGSQDLQRPISVQIVED